MASNSAKDYNQNITKRENNVVTETENRPMQFISDEDLAFVRENIDSLPSNVKSKFRELETAFQEGEVTEKGFHKKCTALLLSHLQKLREDVNSVKIGYVEPTFELLPTIVQAQLDELDRELKDEEVTIKGYRRKREKILAPYMLKEPPLSTLPKSLQKSLEVLENELKDGDLTVKGYKKRRTKLVSPYLVKVNDASVNANVLPDSENDVVTVFMPTPERKNNDPDHAVGIQIINGNEKLFKCQLCNEVFKQAQSFSGHCRLHRTGKPKAFKCTVCKLSYTTRSHLKFHMFKHTGNYPYTCEFCGKGFAGRSQHRYHTLRHTGQSPYICKECGGRFWKKRNLDVHCAKHRSDDAQTGLQRCAHCHAMFESLDDLQTHMYEHENEIDQGVTMVSNIKESPGSLSSGNGQSEHAMEEEHDDDDEEDMEDHEDVATMTTVMVPVSFEETS
eukprot:gene15943-17546_t